MHVLTVRPHRVQGQDITDSHLQLLWASGLGEERSVHLCKGRGEGGTDREREIEGSGGQR